MGFGGKLKKTSELTIDGMTFEVTRITNFIRREISEIDRSDKSMIEKIKTKRDFYARNMIKGWSGVTEKSLSHHVVSNATHYGSASFDVDGDNVDINRVSFDDLFDLILLNNDEDVYKYRASIAIDHLLETKDAKINYNGDVRKMNASIREEIKDSEDWDDVVTAIWDMAADANSFKKNDLSNNEIKFSESAVSDYLVGAYQNVTSKHILDEIYNHAMSTENFREQSIKEEEETAKN